MTLREAFTGRGEYKKFPEAEGLVSAEYIYLYPPGIPLVAPGEVITREIADLVARYRESGLNLKGPSRIDENLIKVVI